MSLRKFYKKLQTFRVGEHYDRRPYCYLEFEHNGKTHNFEVRYWKMEGYKITLSVVNWTLCAGPAKLELTGRNYKKWVIKESI